MTYPRVLVGCPTYEGFGYCLDKFVNRMKELTYQNYDILMVDNSEGDDYYNKIKEKGINVIKAKRSDDVFKTVAESRNLIIDFALENGYDYLLNMDQDVIPQTDIIEELMRCDKDIISGLYFSYFDCSGKIKLLPVAYKCITKEEFEEMQKIQPFPSFIKSNEDIRRNLTKDELEEDNVLEVKIPSNGCMLIRRKVLENKKIRYGMIDMTGKVGKTSDEIHFCDMAKEEGFKIYVYTKIKCEHLMQINK